jgi:hypothetical protein
MNRSIRFKILIITLIALALRFYRISNQSFWTDEVASIDTARAPFDKITELSAAMNNSLPCYFVLLRPLVGPSAEHIEFRARAISALAGGITVPFFIWTIYWWRRHWGAAFAAGLVLALNPLHLWYSQEVRAYAVMLFAGVLTLFFYERSRAMPSVGWKMGYICCAILAMVMHKTGMTFFFACVAWHAWDVSRKRSLAVTLWPHALVLLAAIGVAVAKSYPPTPELRRSGSILEIAYTGLTYIGGYSFGPSITEIQNFGPLQAVHRHLPQVVIAAVLLLAVAVIWMIHARALLRSREALLLTLGIGFVVAATVFSDFPYNVRYTLPALLGFAGLVGALSDRGKAGRLAIVAVVVVELWADGQWFYKANYRKGDSRAVAQWLMQNQNSIETWTALPDYLIPSILFYLPDNSRLEKGAWKPAKVTTTSFPPYPDALIIGRRHHLPDADKLIGDYWHGAIETSEIRSIAGFEIYSRKALPLVRPSR